MTIKLTQGYEAIVDDEDYKYLSQWKWHYNAGYAIRGIYVGTGRKNRKMVKVLMHRVINKTPNGYDTDHINRNKLDNRKLNLRSVVRSFNIINSKLRKDNTYGVRGVFWNKSNNNWRSAISINNKKISLGSFKTIEEAIEARKKAEVIYHAI